MQLFTTHWKNNHWAKPLDSALDSANTLLYVFGSPKLQASDDVFTTLKQAYPHSQIVGCSTAGEIFQNQVLDNSLSLAVTRFEKSTIKTVTSEITSAEASQQIGRTLAAQLLTPHLKAVFIVSDGLCINGSDLVAGVKEALPNEVLITGGLAGDGSDFKRTWQISQGLPHAGTISMTGFYGDALRVATGSFGGWDAFGPKRKVTRSQKNLLFEIDGEPALAVYKKYLADKAKDLPGSALLFPLAMHSPNSADEAVVRTILSIDEGNQSMTFAGDIPEGATVQLMHANFDRLIDGAAEAASMTDVSAWVGPVLSIAISCVGRRLVLGQRIEDEVEAVLENLPKQTQQVGFYSYGEISSGKLQTCQLHNQTMTLTLLSEI